MFNDRVVRCGRENFGREEYDVFVVMHPLVRPVLTRKDVRDNVEFPGAMVEYVIVLAEGRVPTRLSHIELVRFAEELEVAVVGVYVEAGRASEKVAPVL